MQCSSDDMCVFERDVVPYFAKTEQMMAYLHEGFWYCMDTLRDQEHLESLWATDAPWKVWNAKENFQLISSQKNKEVSIG